MKITFGVTFLLIINFVAAQSRPVNFSRIDWAVQFVNAPTPEALSQQLTAPYSTDLEKVRSIFRWITEHIAYAARPRATVSRNAIYYKQLPVDSLLGSKSADEIVAYTVLQRRTAVCNGYARLFKTLCQYAGIRAEVVSGYARGDLGNAKFRSNHSWNAVYVDSAWHLVDATWASGFVSYSDEFVKQYDDFFFFPAPEQFVRSHYPEDLKWALLSDLPTLQEFYHAPFKLTAFMKYGISGYMPASGVLEASVGDTLRFAFELNNKTATNMAPELNADSMMLSGVAAWEFLKPDVVGNRVVYRYPVQSENVAWVHLVYNNDVILRYKLNIRKPKS